MKNKKKYLILVFILFISGCVTADDMYYGEIPQKFITNNKGKIIENPEYKNYVRYWGEPEKDRNGNLINKSKPKEVILDENGRIKFK